MWNRTENQIKLVLIRHGETAANRERRYLGRTDERLSGEGKEKLLQYDRKGIYPRADMVFISPMKRCKETAQLLYAQVAARELPEWAEMDFGDFEGKNYKDLQQDERYQAWIDSNGMLPFPNGESREVFIERCMRGMGKMVQYLHEETKCRQIKNVAAVVHGGTIMALLSSCCGGEYYDYQVQNGEGFVCRLILDNGERKRLDILSKIEKRE